MTIEEQFNLIAQKYDINRRRFIPCFEEFYEKTTDFLAACIPAPNNILDLGAGTGLLSYYWYRHFPEASFILTDIAGDMLKIARERFSGADNVECRLSDYSEELPPEKFDLIVSALSVHHLENSEKIGLFERIYGKLPEGGSFVNYDQFCADEPAMTDLYDSYWENSLSKSGLTEGDIDLWKQRRKLDRECSVTTETKMLRECGFKTVQCVYSCRKFAVITAVKQR